MSPLAKPPAAPYRTCPKCGCSPKKHHGCAPSNTLPSVESYCECGAEDCNHFHPGIVPAENLAEKKKKPYIPPT